MANMMFDDNTRTVYQALLYDETDNIISLAKGSDAKIATTEFNEAVNKIEFTVQAEINDITVVASEIDPDP